MMSHFAIKSIEQDRLLQYYTRCWKPASIPEQSVYSTNTVPQIPNKTPCTCHIQNIHLKYSLSPPHYHAPTAYLRCVSHQNHPDFFTMAFCECSLRSISRLRESSSPIAPSSW